MSYPKAIILCLLLCGCFLVASFRLVHQGEPFGGRDFVAFWSGAKLFTHGLNPYDAAQVLELQREIYPERQVPQHFINPPWSLPVFSPFAFFGFRTANALWSAFNIVLLAFLPLMVAICFELKEIKPIHFASAILSLPAFYCVLMGQLTLVVVYAVLGFIHFLKREQRFGAGVCLGMLLLKPHLVLLFGIAVLVKLVRERRYQVVASGIVWCLVLAILPLFKQPRIYQLWQAQQFSPFAWKSSTLANIVREVVFYFLGYAPVFPAIALSSAAVIGAVIYFYNHPVTERILFLLIPFSLIVAPYALPYDFCLLIPSQMIITQQLLKKPNGTLYAWASMIVLQGSILLVGLWFRHLQVYFYVPILYGALQYKLKSVDSV